MGDSESESNSEEGMMEVQQEEGVDCQPIISFVEPPVAEKLLRAKLKDKLTIHVEQSEDISTCP